MHIWRSLKTQMDNVRLLYMGHVGEDEDLGVTVEGREKVVSITLDVAASGERI